jgi:hypothetical protein
VRTVCRVVGLSLLIKAAPAAPRPLGSRPSASGPGATGGPRRADRSDDCRKEPFHAVVGGATVAAAARSACSQVGEVPGRTLWADAGIERQCPAAWWTLRLILGVYSPLSIAARLSVSRVGVS